MVLRYKLAISAFNFLCAGFGVQPQCGIRLLQRWATLPGLLHQISAALNVSLVNAPVIGDSLRDLEAAQSAGAQPILVRTGNGRKTESNLPSGLATIDVYDDLATAATALLSE